MPCWLPAGSRLGEAGVGASRSKDSLFWPNPVQPVLLEQVNPARRALQLKGSGDIWLESGLQRITISGLSISRSAATPRSLKYRHGRFLMSNVPVRHEAQDVQSAETSDIFWTFRVY